jgi:hypothetical protein
VTKQNKKYKDLQVEAKTVEEVERLVNLVLERSKKKK